MKTYDSTNDPHTTIFDSVRGWDRHPYDNLKRPIRFQMDRVRSGVEWDGMKWNRMEEAYNYNKILGHTHTTIRKSG